jgi:predicted nucleic acid-binding protein
VGRVKAANFFDTYALIEFLAGREEFRKHAAHGIVTTRWNVAELLVLDLRDRGEEAARRDFRRFLGACTEVKDMDLWVAGKFKEEQRKKNRSLSFPDSLGYMVARRLKLRFVTGDDQFQGLPGVLFQK